MLSGLWKNYFWDYSLCTILLFFICQMLQHMEPNCPRTPRNISSTNIRLLMFHAKAINALSVQKD